MRIIACVDNSMGLCFNHRRVSKDQVVIDQISQIEPLYVSAYSKTLFPKGNVVTRFDSLKDDDTCFIEDRVPDERNISEIILYKWNRDYPSDLALHIDLSKWKRMESIDFTGRSHDTITRERYRR